MMGRQGNPELLIMLRGIATNLPKKFAIELVYLLSPFWLVEGGKTDGEYLHLDKKDLILLQGFHLPLTSPPVSHIL